MAAAKKASKVEKLAREARALGVKTGFVMPIDEIRLAHELSQQQRDEAVPTLIALASHDNMHARRVGISALHRMKAWDIPEVFELFLERLRDPEGWVRYDAAWALGESGTSDRRVIKALEALAKDAQPDCELGDADARAARRAAESLALLRGKPN